MRTLLVDTNRAAYPIYQYLCEKGYEVWVVGRNPAETLAQLAKNYRQLDYSDTKKLAAFIDTTDFDYVVPGCTDLSYQVCAEICGASYPGFETVENFNSLNTKSTFREITHRLAIPSPKVLRAEEALEYQTVIVKPADSYSGRGVSVLQSPTESSLQNALDTAQNISPSGNVLIEEYVQGQLFSHSAFLSQGRICADFIVREDCVKNTFAVDTSTVVFGFNQQQLDSIRCNILKLAQSLQLVDGLIHTQFIANDDRYWIIEITRRCPGDIYSLLIEFSTGYPYAASYTAPFIGETAEPLPATTEYRHIIRHTITPEKELALWGFSFSQPVTTRLFVPLATSGSKLLPGTAGRAGIFFLDAATLQEKDILYEKLLNGSLYSLQ